MPETNEGLLFIVGAIFFFIGLIGGGLEISAIKIPPIGKVTRILVFGVGAFLMGVALFRLMQPAASPVPTATPENTPTTLPTATDTSLPPTATVAMPAETLPPTETPAPSETPAPTSSPGSARIDNIWVDKDAVQFGKEGLLIHVKFQVDGMENVSCLAGAYFYFETGEALVDHNGLFNTVNGKVATYKNFTPVYPSAAFSDFELFLPYEELELPQGQYTLKFSVSIFDSTNTQLTVSPYYVFDYP